MAIEASIKVQSKELTSLLQRGNKLQNIPKVLAAIADLELSATRQRFLKQVDPSGTPWKTTKRKEKNPSAKILRKSGVLFNSLSKKIIGNKAFIGTNISYGLFHQTGVPSRGLPKRQFIGNNAQTTKNIKTVISQFINKEILK